MARLVLGEDESQAIIEHAIDLGINFFDTANMYSEGESERILGDALAGHREESVVASKCYFEMANHQNAGGLSRKAIEQELAASRERLGMETIDLYQIHRWDESTPVEATLVTLDDAVRRDHVRHTGASSMWAYQFATALHTSDRRGYDRFATMQNHYNLLYREEEREMLPLCAQESVRVLPWSPLARGSLARTHDEREKTGRGKSDTPARRHPYLERGGREINERV